MAEKKRYVVVGTGGRSEIFIKGLVGPHADMGEIVGLCDLSPTRMAFYNTVIAGKLGVAVPAVLPDKLEQLISDTKADYVIVTTPDYLHDHYIVRAMRAGCDVICEKPMTTDDARCRTILQAIEATGRKLTVTFNYRYSPKCTKVKELLAGGIIGQIKHVDFEWLLDTSHGADYFRRWHRHKRFSGGLLVHKSTHHFDFANWCLEANPTEVFARGSLAFYGAANGNGPAGRTDRCQTCKVQCDFRYDLSASKRVKSLYLDAECDNDYHRDQCIFADGIDAEDNASLVVRYDSGATMSYSLVAFSPYEGSRITFTGTKGRLEFTAPETLYGTNEAGGYELKASPHEPRIEIFPMFKPSYVVPFEQATGGHGGADPKLLSDIFRGAGNDPLNHAADHWDGARSILIGIAANHSMATGEPIKINDLVTLPPKK
jgi:predicted dehydrogenase